MRMKSQPPNPIKAFSAKQRQAILWWKQPKSKDLQAIICHGAVRSGKTLCLSLGFILWAFAHFSDTPFAICGKTITSVKRNVVEPLIPMLADLGFSCKQKLSANRLELTIAGRTNRFYLFGGKDEGSAGLIQGMTLAGVLLDEAVLMPRSFVEQALARCSLPGSRFWFNCNPQHPGHWFYKEWILKAKEKSTLVLHFTLEDNPGISQAIKARYRSLYSGIFYQRFVEGLWVASSGLVYPMFSKERHVFTEDKLPDFQRYYISCDYGTVNPASFGLWGEDHGKWYRIKEYYHDSRATGILRTDEEHCRSLLELCGSLPIDGVICDPSAASFMEALRRLSAGRFPIIPAKNDVLSGIRRVASMLQEGRLLFSQSCSATFREFELYSWEENAPADHPKKEFDHAMDDIRYLVNTVAALKPPSNPFSSLSRPLR